MLRVALLLAAAATACGKDTDGECRNFAHCALTKLEGALDAFNTQNANKAQETLGDVVGETELSVGSASAPAETPRGSLAAKDGCDPRTRGRRIPNENGNSWLDKRLPLVTPIARDGEPVNPETEQ